MKRKLLVGAAMTGGFLLLAAPAFAQDEGPSAAAVQVILDNIWILIAAVLVIFMQAGFALVEAGLTRAKNVANIIMKNLMDFCVGVVLFFAVVALSPSAVGVTGNGKFIGADGWFLAATRAQGYLAPSTARVLHLPGGLRRNRGHDRVRGHGRAHASSRPTSSTASSSRRSSTRSSSAGSGAAAGCPPSARRSTTSPVRRSCT